MRLNRPVSLIATDLSGRQQFYRSLTIELKKYALLETARLAGLIPSANELFLSISLFGNHGLEFLALLADTALSFSHHSIPLKIVVYGAGFFSASDVFRLAGDVDSETVTEPAYLSFISNMEQELFEENRGTSYEPREILALFLPGDRPGSLTVYDMDERVRADLAKPEFVTTTVSDTPGRYQDFLQRYRRLIFSGRHVTTSIDKAAGLPPIDSAQVTFTPDEMAKVRVEERDFVLDGFPDTGDKFDFSVWLEGAYFFTQPVQIAILAGITERTVMGGFILNDIQVSKALTDLLGVKAVRIYSTDNAVLSGKKRSLILLQKIREMPFVDKLSRLLRGEKRL